LKRAYQNREAGKPVEAVAGRAVHIALSMAEVLSSLEQGLGKLVRKVGRIFMGFGAGTGAGADCRPRSRRIQARKGYRWGVEQGLCPLRGRVCASKELPLGTYQLFQGVSPAEETV
jgi:hypothetical protein